MFPYCFHGLLNRFSKTETLGNFYFYVWRYQAVKGNRFAFEHPHGQKPFCVCVCVRVWIFFFGPEMACAAEALSAHKTFIFRLWDSNDAELMARAIDLDDNHQTTG